MIRLACIPINNRIFSLYVLGATNEGNRRIIHLDTGVYECKKLQLILVNSSDERFNFRVNGDKCSFIAAEDGKYKLELTSDLMLKEIDEPSDYFIEVLSRGTRQLAKVTLA